MRVIICFVKKLLRYYYKKSANQLKTYYVVAEKNVTPFKSYVGV